MEIIDLFEKLAEHGHAPSDKCKLLTVGYEDAFERLKKKYLEQRFAKGGSAEKFVIGPFGSGKTHFMRHLMEIATELDCVTAEVALNKDVDFTKNIIVYREVAKEIKVPGQHGKGMRTLLLECKNRIQNKVPNKDLSREFFNAWVSGLEQASFELELFGVVARLAFEAEQDGNETLFNAACRWLGGEVTDRFVAKELALSCIPEKELNLYGRRALLSLSQFIRHAGFRGTVICFDEAEQGLGVDKRKMNQILSMLQSGINAVSDLQNGSLLIIFGLTPDIITKMENLEALRQRVADPGIGQGFFDGNTLAPKIDLTRRKDPVQDLRAIGRRLVEVLYSNLEKELNIAMEEVLNTIDQVAVSIAESDPTTSNRRTMVKKTCTILIRLYEDGILEDVEGVDSDDYESEV